MPLLSNQSSFRRILLSRIFLLLVPVVVLGEWMVYSKARQSLLSATQQHLTATAVHTANALEGHHPPTEPHPPLGLTSNTASQLIVVQADGTLLQYPQAQYIGRKLQDLPAGRPSKALLQEIVQQFPRSLPAQSVETDRWLAGYAMVQGSGSQWSSSSPTLVLALMPTEQALQSLREMRWILIGFTGVLLSSALLAAVFIARELASPVEALRDYALQILTASAGAESAPPLPLDRLKSREVSQLAEALQQVLEQLAQHTHDLEVANREALSASKLKTQFLAATSHELRTPLNAIIGHIHLLKDDCCDDRQEELESLAQADQAALHLLSVLNDLLDIARIEAGEFLLEKESFDLRELVTDALKLQSPTLEGKGLRLQVAFLDRPLIVWADPAKLRQVVLNVMANAIKFTDQGCITVTTHIQFAKGLNRNRWVRLQVTDTGIGIAPDQQQLLFRPFARAQGQAQRTYEGTGLGLAICRTLMERMGGNITLRSPGLGHGTTIEISLPLVEVPAEIVASPSPHLHQT